MYQVSPKDVAVHLGRMGRKVPKGESSIEYLINVIQEYDQSELGVEALAAFALTGMKPPPLGEHEMSVVPSLPASSHRSNKRLDHLRTNAKKDQDFDHSLRSPWNSSKSWSASHSGVLQTLGFSPATQRADHRNPNPIR